MALFINVDLMYIWFQFFAEDLNFTANTMDFHLPLIDLGFMPTAMNIVNNPSFWVLFWIVSVHWNNIPKV